jgi:hypothetical protein
VTQCVMLCFWKLDQYVLLCTRWCIVAFFATRNVSVFYKMCVINHASCSMVYDVYMFIEYQRNRHIFFVVLGWALLDAR